MFKLGYFSNATLKYYLIVVLVCYWLVSSSHPEFYYYCIDSTPLLSIKHYNLMSHQNDKIKNPFDIPATPLPRDRRVSKAHSLVFSWLVNKITNLASTFAFPFLNSSLSKSTSQSPLTRAIDRFHRALPHVHNVFG